MTTQKSDNKKIRSVNLIVSIIAGVALICYAAYLLVGIYPDVLITAQDRNPFAGDSLYFSELTAKPFGLMQYIGGYLTQFFYNPAIGAALLIALWAASVFAGIKAFRLLGVWRALMIVPVACLLASVLDLGYWVYCLNIPGYWFSQSVAFLCLMLLLWAANTTNSYFQKHCKAYSQYIRIVWYMVIGFALFPVFGWMSYLFAVCFALSQLGKDDNGKVMISWVDGTGITLAAVAPLVFRALIYQNIPTQDIFCAGFPLFRTPTDTTEHLVYPFYIIAGITVFMSLGRVLPALKKIPSCVAYVIVGIASAAAVWSTMFKDMNYLYEMQMTQATMDDDWQGVISVAEKTKTPSRTMVMLKNIALLNTDQLPRSFEIGNDGIEIYNPDSLNLSIMHIASPLVYYNHGEVNFANRWCMEFAIPYGFSPYQLKMLVRCAEANGEPLLAQRYLSRLHRLAYYKDWQPKPVTPVVKELRNVIPDGLENDENNVERFIISSYGTKHYANTKYCCELNMFYALLTRNAQNFWATINDYLALHEGKQLPAIYEEALCLFMDKAPTGEPVSVTPSPATIERYKQFWNVGNGYAQAGLDEDGVRETMREEWGGTYWWFNAFGRSRY